MTCGSECTRDAEQRIDSSRLDECLGALAGFQQCTERWEEYRSQANVVVTGAIADEAGVSERVCTLVRPTISNVTYQLSVAIRSRNGNMA